MKVAVTGISSYLAQVLMPIVENDPDIREVLGIDIVAPPHFEKCRFSKRDVRDPLIEDDLNGCDSLVHLAFIVMPIRGESKMDSINIDGTKNVFRAAAKKGIKKIVYTSSVAAYGAWEDNPPEITEDQPPRPMMDFYYSRTKAKIEKWLDTLEKEYPDIKVVRLRPCIFLGPKIKNMMLDIVTAKIVPGFKNIESKTQYVWDEDVASAIHLSLKMDVHGAFNIAGDGYMSMKDVANELQRPYKEVPYKLSLFIVNLIWKLRLRKMSHPGWIKILKYPIIMDCSKAKKELGWQPTYTTVEAFRRFIKALEV